MTSNAHLRWVYLIFSLFLPAFGSEPSRRNALQQRVAHRQGYLVPLNARIVLTCPYDTPFYKWSHIGHPDSMLDESQNLTIHATSAAAVNGRYQCSAVNGFGTSLAEMSIRVIDPNTMNLDRECDLSMDDKKNIGGLCFLNSYSDSEMIMTRYWGEDVTFDCSVVMADGRTYFVNHSWEFYKHLSPPGGSIGGGQHSRNSGVPILGPQSESPNGGTSPHSASSSTSSADVSRFSEPQLTLRRVSMGHQGEYRCSVALPSQDSTVPAIPKIERIFQLRVIPHSEGAIIIGDHNLTLRVKAGENLIEVCKVNAEQHRSVTIRWGKTIDTKKSVDTYDSDTKKDVIHLSNSAFVVFKSYSAIELEAVGTKDDTGPVAVTEAGSSESRLLLRRVSRRDSGLYICSVLTESGRDDQKFVKIQVIDADGLSAEDVSQDGSFAGRLALYIAVPIFCFFIFIFMLTYCLMSRKGRCGGSGNVTTNGNGGRHTRATLPTNQPRPNQTGVMRGEHGSATSSSSVGVYRAGINGSNVLSGSNKSNTGANNIKEQHRGGHSSSQGAPNVALTNQIAYSSSTGSHSLSGTSGGTPGSMLLANTMMQVLPPDGSGYPLLNTTGHPHNGYPSQHDSYMPGQVYASQGINGYHHE